MSSSRFRTQLIVRRGALKRKAKFSALTSATSTFKWFKPHARAARLHRHIRGLWLGNSHDEMRARS